MKKNNLQVEYISINILKPATYNPRRWDSNKTAQLKESIKRFGLVDPIIVNNAPNRKQVVIGGHFRLHIAKKLKLNEIPVVYVNIPDIKKEKELNMRLNKNTGDWDFDKLKSFDLSMLVDIGFDKDELANIWDLNLEAEDDEFDIKEELSKIKKPKTKPGDLIILGQHKLICGNATDPVVLKRLFGKDRASMIYSDPPYNLKVDYNSGIGGKKHYGGNVNDNRTDKEYENFIRESLESALLVTKKDAHVLYYCDQTYIWLVQQLYRELGIQNKRVCLWLKNGQNPTPSVAFSKCYEPCVYGVRGKPYISDNLQNLNEIMNKEITTGNSLLEETLDHLDVWTVKRLSGKDYEHATSKPPKLHEKAIRRCTKPDDIILDSFLGSASTLVAAEQLKRRVYAVELEPVFCDLAIKRYEMLTHKKVKVIKK